MGKILTAMVVFLFSVSSMALEWTVQVEGDAWETEDLNSVTFGNDLFIAAGSMGAAFKSTDGIQWTPNPISPSSFASFKAVIWDGGLFVAVGSSGRISTSPDGTTWTDQSGSVGNTEVYFESVASGDNAYVAVGWAGGGSGGHRIYTSPDAVTWTAQTSPVTTSSARLYGVVWGGDQFVAVGSNGEVMTSDDGVEWTVQTTPGTQTLFAVAWIDGMYYAGGGEMNAYLMTSADAIDWTSQTLPMVNQYYSDIIRTIVPFGDKVAAICKYLYTSEDGTSWDVEDLRSVSDGEVYSGAVIGAGLAVLVGDYGTIITTPESGLVTSSQPRTLKPERTAGFALHRNSPNPVRSHTTFRFTVPIDQSHVVLSVCDLQGRLVSTVYEGAVKAGTHAVGFDAASLTPGQYVYRLKTALGVQQQSLVVTAR